MKKIAYITTSFGVLSHTFIRREVKELRKLGVDISLFGVRPKTAIELSEEDRGLAGETLYLYPLNIGKIFCAHLVFMIKKPRNYFNTFKKALFNEEKNIFRHLKLIYHFFICASHALDMQRKNIAHIHAHFINVPATIAMYAAGFLGIPYSITLHAAGTKGLSSVAAPREKIKSAKFLCSVSNYNIAYYDSVYPCRDKIFLAHCGVGPDDYRFTPKRNLPAEDGKIRLIGVGRLVEKKGFIYLIKACKNLTDEGANFELTIIGGGPLRKFLKARTKEYNLEDNIVFRGSCSEAEVKNALTESDICIAPSCEAADGEKEGIPVVIMEAMAAGVAVIATEHSGIPEIVKNRKTGVLVSERNPQVIAEAVKMLARDENLRKSCAENARKIVTQKFNIKDIAKLKKRIFEENI